MMYVVIILIACVGILTLLLIASTDEKIDIFKESQYQINMANYEAIKEMNANAIKQIRKEIANGISGVETMLRYEMCLERIANETAKETNEKSERDNC